MTGNASICKELGHAAPSQAWGHGWGGCCGWWPRVAGDGRGPMGSWKTASLHHLDQAYEPCPCPPGRPTTPQLGVSIQSAFIRKSALPLTTHPPGGPVNSPKPEERQDHTLPSCTNISCYGQPADENSIAPHLQKMWDIEPST